MSITINKCSRCSNKWVSRKKSVPKQCPKCKSKYWNNEKVRFAEKKTIEINRNIIDRVKLLKSDIDSLMIQIENTE